MADETSSARVPPPTSSLFVDANQAEQWFSILQLKRHRIADIKDKAHLAERLVAFIEEWNQIVHPFGWRETSITKVLAHALSNQRTPSRTKPPPENRYQLPGLST